MFATKTTTTTDSTSAVHTLLNTDERMNLLRARSEPGTFLAEFDALLLKLYKKPDEDTDRDMLRRYELRRQLGWTVNQSLLRLEYLLDGKTIVPARKSILPAPRQFGDGKPY